MDQSSTTSKITRTLRGRVVSNKMQKTVVVAVDNLKMHRKYKKYFKVTKRYQVHNEEMVLRPGDVVKFKATRPISKNKRWIVTEKVSSAKEELAEPDQILPGPVGI